jgi:hypothetical protein
MTASTLTVEVNGGSEHRFLPSLDSESLDSEPRNFGGIAAALTDLDDLPRNDRGDWIIAVHEVKGMQRVFISAAQAFDLVWFETRAFQ